MNIIPENYEKSSRGTDKNYQFLKNRKANLMMKQY